LCCAGQVRRLSQITEHGRDAACDKPISEEQLGNEGKKLSIVGSGEGKNGRCGIRTHDPLIKSQQTQNCNCRSNNDLHKPEKRAYKPAYKENPKTAQNQVKDPDLAMVVERWPNLPEHIKAAIKALIQTNNTEKK